MKEAWEELDPQKVLALFENIREEDIPYFNMKGNICKPADLILV
jgi:hypothetical protein